MQEDVVIASGVEGQTGVAVVHGVVCYLLHAAEVVVEMEVVHGSKCRGVLVVLQQFQGAETGVETCLYMVTD